MPTDCCPSKPGSPEEAKIQRLSTIAPDDWFIPRNTVSFSLDGSDQEIFRSFVLSVGHEKLHNAVYGDEISLEVLCDMPIMMYTTPPSGTFHFIFKEKSDALKTDALNFIIDARLGWLYAVACPKGLFTFKDSCTPYINHTAARSLPFQGSYRYCSFWHWKPGSWYFSSKKGFPHIG